ncbi:MAG: phospholipid carrier-dependent glycosyltransferase [Candidatus Shapirobacteria bacterium]
MNTKVYLLLLFLVFALGLTLRLYKLTSYPPLLWDEAAIGYNAYSLLLTGADEHGVSWPLIFKSFGDYKPGLYIYLTLPSVAIFGLNTFAVRFPSALIGSLTGVLLIHFLRRRGLPPLLCFLTGLFVVFSPFNLHFSRGAWETNLLSFLLLLFVTLFSSRRYFLSALVAGVSLYSYQAAKLIVPLIMLASAVTFPPLFNLKNVSRFFLPLFVLAIPLLLGLLNADSSRLKVVSLFSYPPALTETNQIITEGGQLDYNLLHNRSVHYLYQFLSRYFNHLSPKFLFTSGDWPNPRHSAPYLGLLLLPSIFLLPLGLFHRFTPRNKPIFIFFFLWLIFAPIPSALTRDSVSAVRSQSLSIPLAFFSALGVYYLFNIKSRFLKYLSLGSVFIVASFSFVLYLDSYYNHLVRVTPFDWLYGNRQASELLIENQSKYQHLYFSDFYGQPYIFYLFYSGYSPARYQSSSSFSQFGPDTGSVSQIDNITFGPINFSQLSRSSSVYAVISFDEVMRQGINLDDLTPISSINNLSTYYVYHRP